MPNHSEVIGKKFNRLTPLRRDRSREDRECWICKCDCGNEKSIPYRNFKYGTIMSCGCLHAKANRTRAVTHGMTGSAEHTAWKGMRERCYSKSCKAYPHYGGRGILVCSRWDGEDGFINFYHDMGARPSLDHSIDRRNNDKGYSPDNCRWATRKEQTNNTRRNKFYTANGMTKSMAQWSDATGIAYRTIHSRISTYGWTVDRAVNTPVIKRNHAKRPDS